MRAAGGGDAAAGLPLRPSPGGRRQDRRRTRRRRVIWAAGGVEAPDRRGVQMMTARVDHGASASSSTSPCRISGWSDQDQGRWCMHASFYGFCVSEGKWTQTLRGKKKDKNLNYYVDVGTWGVEEAQNLRISIHAAKERVSIQTQRRWNHCTASKARVLQDRGEECEVTDKSYR